MSLTEFMSLAPLMNPREDVAPEDREGEIQAAAERALAALYRADSARMLGDRARWLLAVQSAYQELREVFSV